MLAKLSLSASKKERSASIYLIERRDFLVENMLNPGLFPSVLERELCLELGLRKIRSALLVVLARHGRGGA